MNRPPMASPQLAAMAVGMMKPKRTPAVTAENSVATARAHCRVVKVAFAKNSPRPAAGNAGKSRYQSSRLSMPGTMVSQADAVLDLNNFNLTVSSFVTIVGTLRRI